MDEHTQVHEAVMSWIVLFCVCILYMNTDTVTGATVTGCPYEFENLNQLISIDWSASEGDVVYTLSIRHQYQTTTAATNTTTSYGTSAAPSPQEPYIFLATKASPFVLHPKNNREILVRDCLLPKTRYELWFYIMVNGTLQTCGSQKQQQLPGILDIKTKTAVPLFTSSKQTYVFAPVGNLAISWVNLFKIELSNDEYFEGCGLFKCEADCRGSDQEFEINKDNFDLEVKRESLKEDFTYIVDIICVDYYVDDPKVTKDNIFNVNVTFSHQATASGNIIGAGTPATNVMTKPVYNYSTASGYVPTTLATANINEHSYFFDNVWNLVAVTTAGSILMIVICSCLALIGYRIRKKRKRMTRVIQVREM